MTRYIDADKIITDMDDMKVDGEVFTTAVNYVKLIVEDAPTVDAEPVKHGKWENYIADTGVEHWRVIRCSECEKVAIERYNYCPNCGARMENE